MSIPSLSAFPLRQTNASILVIARREATKQSRRGMPAHWIASPALTSGSLAMTGGLLAMTSEEKDHEWARTGSFVDGICSC
ncbi:MAG: hypothetical protein LBT00_02765 [Spirochaetaceae bacterium]|nr:hypothetical protein [Spirochaetaceae bacterium]